MLSNAVHTTTKAKIKIKHKTQIMQSFWTFWTLDLGPFGPRSSRNQKSIESPREIPSSPILSLGGPSRAYINGPWLVPSKDSAVHSGTASLTITGKALVRAESACDSPFQSSRNCFSSEATWEIGALIPPRVHIYSHCLTLFPPWVRMLSGRLGCHA